MRGSSPFLLLPLRTEMREIYFSLEMMIEEEEIGFLPLLVPFSSALAD